MRLEVKTHNLVSPAEFLQTFRDAVARSDEGIELTVCSRNGVEMLEPVLGDEGAARVRVLDWYCYGRLISSTQRIVPLLANCVNLRRMEVRFGYQSELDFVSAVLERGCGVVQLHVNSWEPGNVPRFFRALSGSEVVTFTTKFESDTNSKCITGLCEVIVQGKLKRLYLVCEEHQMWQLAAALWHPGCALSTINIILSRSNMLYDPVLVVRAKFGRCQRMFALLQGQQLKRRKSPLKRLPVELIRMVSALL